MGTRLTIAAAMSIATTATGVLAPALPSHASSQAVEVTEQQVEGTPEPGGAPVELDVSFHAPPGAGPHPAVLLTHGFGGSKDDVADQAESLADEGYLVLSYTARGFGESGGLIRLADPDFEIADVSLLVDVLAERDDVLLDADGDPRVAAVGGSYGGALAIMGAALDDRIDSVAALITWNDLAEAFFPQNADGPAASGPGPFKQLWASNFFLSAVAGAAESDATPGAAAEGALCGRFEPVLCRRLLVAATNGSGSSGLLRQLAAKSPAAVLDSTYDTPTFLVQGMADSLFGVDQAVANAEAMRDGGAPVAMRWIDGGHDALSSTAVADEEAIREWLDGTLRENSGDELPVPELVFADTRSPGERDTDLRMPTDDGDSLDVEIDGSAEPILTPPGGQPSSVTTVPGLGALLGGATGDESDEEGDEGGFGDELVGALSTYPLAALPGQSAAFDTVALDLAPESRVVGAPEVDVEVTSTGEESTLFASLWLVAADDPTQPRFLSRTVSPFTLRGDAGETVATTLTLPTGGYRVLPGDRLRVLVTSTDQTFSNPRAPRADSVAVTAMRLPVRETAEIETEGAGLDAEAVTVGSIAGGLIVLLLVAAGVRRVGRDDGIATEGETDEAPLVVDRLVKTYADGHRAVDDVSWRADRGQVVGLLGPNGAGKTTTLRMVMGLISADSGESRVLGRRVTPGASMLRDVGALIEGPGFLPHLTGRENLRAYWAATGRPEGEADYEQAEEVAALGGAIDRPVKTYSQGMRQRLGIAQAMLGSPEVLVLDEPTNGLDPPQIAGLRPILQAYADAGRTVVVSSHLLAEVEMTCSHVVVMHAGRVVTTGRVDELLADDHTTELTLASTPGAEQVDALRAALADVTVEVGATDSTLIVTADDSRDVVVRAAVDAGLAVTRVSGHKHLEEVFLGVISEASGADLRQVRAR